MWEKLIEKIKQDSGHFSFYGTLVPEDQLMKENINAYNYCNNVMEELDQVSAKYYAECLQLFERMQKLTRELSALKIKLDIN